MLAFEHGLPKSTFSNVNRCYPQVHNLISFTGLIMQMLSNMVTFISLIELQISAMSRFSTIAVYDVDIIAE